MNTELKITSKINKAEVYELDFTQYNLIRLFEKVTTNVMKKALQINNLEKYYINYSTNLLTKRRQHEL